MVILSKLIMAMATKPVMVTHRAYLVSVGDDIRKDQQIAMVGCTGRCTGPHLHYEIVREGKRQDPSMYLALAPKRDE